MKKLTATILTLAMLCAVSCNGNTNEPAQTTVGDGASTSRTTTETVTETTAAVTETTVAETDETTAPEPALPEFDINSEECLMYRLMGMTYSEIEAEFGEKYNITIVSVETGDKGLRLYLNEDTSLQIAFSRKYHYSDDPEWDWNKTLKYVTPSYISLMNDSLLIYPGVKISMTVDDVVKTIPEWSNVAMSQDNSIETYAKFEGYCLCVDWKVTDEAFVGEVKKATENKNWEERLNIMQKYAKEFVSNMDKYSATVSSVSLYDEDYLKKLNYLGFN